MNYSKKHKKHVDYRMAFNYLADERSSVIARSIIFCKSRKSRRKSMRELEKDIRSGAWQKRLWEQRGIRIRTTARKED